MWCHIFWAGCHSPFPSALSCICYQPTKHPSHDGLTQRTAHWKSQDLFQDSLPASIKKLWDMDFKYVDFKRGTSLSKYLKSAENCSMAFSQPSWSNMPKHLSVTLLKLSRATVSFRHFADTLASISMLSNLSMLFSSFLTWFPSNFPPASHFDGCSLHLTNQRQWCCSQEVFVAFYWDSQKCG